MLITLDMGKPISDSRDEASSTTECLRYYAEVIDKVYGDVA